MAEYIERKVASAAMPDDYYGWRDKQILNFIPAADVVPVVRGKWVDEPIKGVRYHCSVCQGRFDYTWRFCPNCGARMDGDA